MKDGLTDWPERTKERRVGWLVGCSTVTKNKLSGNSVKEGRQAGWRDIPGLLTGEMWYITFWNSL